MKKLCEIGTIFLGILDQNYYFGYKNRVVLADEIFMFRRSDYLKKDIMTYTLELQSPEETSIKRTNHFIKIGCFSCAYSDFEKILNQAKKIINDYESF